MHTVIMYFKTRPPLSFTMEGTRGHAWAVACCYRDFITSISIDGKIVKF